MKVFPECLNGLGCVRNLIKEHFFWKRWVDLNGGKQTLSLSVYMATKLYV